jgi:dephospho-CoA kinase
MNKNSAVHSTRAVKTIGIIGGIASGKSLVAKMMAEFGGHVLDADRIGHEVLAEDAEVRQVIVDRWGSDVLAADGQIDRRAVAKRVFAPGGVGQGELKFLEELLHPRIHQRLEARLEALSKAAAGPLVVEPSMLLESGCKLAFDVLVMVDAPLEIRLDRAGKRGWSEEQFLAREAAQWSVEEKRRRADVVISNVGTEDDLRQAVRAFWERHVAPQDTLRKE